MFCVLHVLRKTIKRNKTYRKTHTNGLYRFYSGLGMEIYCFACLRRLWAFILLYNIYSLNQTTNKQERKENEFTHVHKSEEVLLFSGYK